MNNENNTPEPIINLDAEPKSDLRPGNFDAAEDIMNSTKAEKDGAVAVEHEVEVDPVAEQDQTAA